MQLVIKNLDIPNQNIKSLTRDSISLNTTCTELVNAQDFKKRVIQFIDLAYMQYDEAKKLESDALPEGLDLSWRESKSKVLPHNTKKTLDLLHKKLVTLLNQLPTSDIRVSQQIIAITSEIIKKTKIIETYRNAVDEMSKGKTPRALSIGRGLEIFEKREKKLAEKSESKETKYSGKLEISGERSRKSLTTREAPELPSKSKGKQEEIDLPQITRKRNDNL